VFYSVGECDTYISRHMLVKNIENRLEMYEG